MPTSVLKDPPVLSLARKSLIPIVVLACAALSVPAAAQAGATCPPTKIAYVAKGKLICLKRAPVKALPASQTPQAVFARLLKRATKSSKLGKVKLSKVKLSKNLSRRLPAIVRAVNKTIKKAQSMNFHARAARFSRQVRASGADANPIVGRMKIEGSVASLGNGVKLSMEAEARAHADDQLDLDLSMVLTSKDEKLKLTPVLDFDSGPPSVPCPTAEGEVVVKEVDPNKMTVSAFKKDRLVASATVAETKTITSTGHVGRDARLHDVTSRVAIKRELYRRGLQVVSQYAGDATIERDGKPVAGTATVDSVKIKAASASSAQERAAERQEAADIAADPETGQSIGSAASSHRYFMLENEKKWYDIPNSCATAAYTPDSIGNLGPRGTTPVQGYVKAADGGVAHGDFAIGSVARGTFTAGKTSFDPGSPAEFTAKGSEPDEDGLTVDAQAIATSTAGRTDANWYARDDGSVEFTFTGHGTYWRNSGNSGTTTQHHVTASYNWSLVYRLNLAEGFAYPLTNSATGTWKDEGRHGVAGPGDFVCGGPTKSYSGEFATATSEKAPIGYKVTAMPFFAVQTDPAQTTCTGLGGPPFESFAVNGYVAANQGVFTFDPDELAAGPITLPIDPATTVPSDCSDIVSTVEQPCSQALTWSGSVTVSRVM